MQISKIFAIFVSVNQRVDIEKYLEEFRSSITRLEGNVAELTGENAKRCTSASFRQREK